MYALSFKLQGSCTVRRFGDRIEYYSVSRPFFQDPLSSFQASIMVIFGRARSVVATCPIPERPFSLNGHFCSCQDHRVFGVGIRISVVGPGRTHQHEPSMKICMTQVMMQHLEPAFVQSNFVELGFVLLTPMGTYTVTGRWDGHKEALVSAI